jgi:hypothetical protein
MINREMKDSPERRITVLPQYSLPSITFSEFSCQKKRQERRKQKRGTPSFRIIEEIRNNSIKQASNQSIHRWTKSINGSFFPGSMSVPDGLAAHAIQTNTQRAFYTVSDWKKRRRRRRIEPNGTIIIITNPALSMIHWRWSKADQEEAKEGGDWRRLIKAKQSRDP